VGQAAEFHSEIGRVVEVRGRRAIVELDDSTGAGTKPECARCGLCSSAGAKDGDPPELRAAVGPELALAPGDRVELRVRLARSGKAGVLLLGLPLASFLGALFLADRLWNSEMATLVCGFGALAAAFVVLHLARRRWGARAEVVRKL
jgi:positive regulator of sigma E activity